MTRSLAGNPLRGALRLALGGRDGILLFGTTARAFLASLAPLIAFPLVGALLLMRWGRFRTGLSFLLFAVIAQVGPAVLSHALAERWGRGALWLRYATAFNWCQWALPAVAFLIILILQLLAGDRLGSEEVSQITLFVVSVYGLWLNWIIARAGLDLSRARAALFVALVNVGVVLMALVPQLVADALG